MANNNNMIRMSGMNSGLDTESIINALTANSKLKITKQNRQLLKYKATQDAYRDIISKMQSLQDKYFDILNKNSNLKGTSMWSQYTTTTTSNGAETNVSGFSASTSIDTVAGDYHIKVNKKATQSTLSGTSLSGGAKVDLSSFEAGKSYGISVTVGSETKNITFTAGATAEETQNTINDILNEQYGESNASAANPADSSAMGLVYVDQNGQFISREGKGITLSGAGEMKSSESLDLSGLKTGNNAVSIQIGDEILNVSFQTLADDYFTPADKVDENGDPVLDEHGNPVKEELSADKQKLYDQVKEDYIESKKYEQYQNWPATEEDREQLFERAFEKAEAAQREKYLDKYLQKEYNSYKKGLPSGTEAQSFDDWKAANFADGDESNELYKGFKDYYYDHDISATLTPEQIAKRDEALNNYIDTQYEAYKDGLADSETPMSKEDWKAMELAKGEGNEVYDGYTAVANKYNKYTGYELDKEGWKTFSYNEYTAYKEQFIDDTEEHSAQFETSLNITDEVLTDHFNTTSIQNSIGEAEMENGVKLNVSVEGGQAKITAVKETPQYELDDDGNPKLDEEGNPIVQTDADGNPIITEEPVDLTVTAGKGSTNSFHIAQATTSVSQISNSTLLSDLGIEANADGKYTFSINGTDFSFSGDTTVKNMMRAVNASEANVKMSYSSLDNAFTITANEYGVNSEVELSDGGEGLLSAIGLGAGASYERGTNLEVVINDKVLESNGNSVTADGTTFTFTGVAQGTEFDVNVAKDYSAITDTIKSFVEDYNKLIEDVYKLLDEKPDKDYYFLADADKEDLDLSEKQEEKWEEKAKQGLLYHDSTIGSVMTKLRTALMGTVEAADGNTIGLAQLGIKTSSDYKEHGKLILDEEALTAAVTEYGEDIAKLFSDKENGIMVKFDEALESAVGTTGDRGTLINKAGMATGTSATDNFIYNQMKRITSRISSLEKRYENEQNRLWKKYSAMESMLGTLNSQSASLSSYFGGMM